MLSRVLTAVTTVGLLMWSRLPQKHRFAFSTGYAIGQFSALPGGRIGRRSNDKFEVCRIGPMKLLLDSSNRVDSGLIKAGWEKVQRAMLFSLVDRVRRVSTHKLVFLDIGAHWGLYGLAALFSGCFDEVHAFEADPVNHAQLQAQLLLNDAIPAITVHNFVVTNARSEMPWSLSTTVRPRNRGGVGVDEQGELRIRGYPLDAVIKPSESIYFIKIDVEGHEREVLHGARRLLLRAKAVLQIESGGTFVDDVSRFLSDLGYRKIGHVNADHYFTNIAGLDLA